jgi:hypothetical protein
MTKREKEYIKSSVPYYGKIPTKGRYTGIKAKAWAILSDFVRCRDWHRYRTCVATGQRIENWRDSDAGHYVPMASHGANIGFDTMNIHMQSKISNKLSSAEDGAMFKETLLDRYGDRIIRDIEESKRKTVKADSWFFIQKIEQVHSAFVRLMDEFPGGDYPDYMKRQ